MRLAGWQTTVRRLRGARSYRAARKGARDDWWWRVNVSDNFQKHSVGLENKKKGVRKWRACKRNVYRCTTSFYQALKSALFIGIKFDLPIARECIESKTFTTDANPYFLGEQVESSLGRTS